MTVSGFKNVINGAELVDLRALAGLYIKSFISMWIETGSVKSTVIKYKNKLHTYICWNEFFKGSNDQLFVITEMIFYPLEYIRKGWISFSPSDQS